MRQGAAAPLAFPPSWRTFLLLIVLLVSACTEPPTVPSAPISLEPVRGDALIGRLHSDPRTFNWMEGNDTQTRKVGRLVAEGLVAVGPDPGQNPGYVPRLAESWEFSDGGKTLTFQLRRNVRWHDGNDFTADDVLHTYHRALAGAAHASTYFTEVVSLDAPSPWTLEVRYKHAIVTALQGWENLLILPRHLWQGVESMDGLDLALAVGTGPFRLESWTTGQEVSLVANEDYWGPRANLDRIVFKVIKNNTTAFEALRTGEIDVTAVTPAHWPTARALPEDGRLRFLRYPYLHVTFIAWNGNGSNPFFTDPRVRRAMTHALDRGTFVKTVRHGLGQVATSTFVPGTWAHDPTMVPLPYDMAAAARLLDEAGWIDHDDDGIRDRNGVPFRFALNYWSTNTILRSLAEVLQSSLRDLGVVMTINPLEGAAFYEPRGSRTYQAMISGWSLDTDPDPFDFWHSSQASAGQNYSGYSDQEVDQLCEEGRREFDPVRRAALYARVQHLLQRDQPFTFLYHIEQVVGIDRRFHGVKTSLLGLWKWYPSTLQWWVPAELQRFAREDFRGAAGE